MISMPPAPKNSAIPSRHDRWGVWNLGHAPLNQKRNTMNINLLCPICKNVLVDRYCAEKCAVFIDGYVFLHMECVKCNKDVKLKLQTAIISED
jgi:hypothetical protein